jgi:hypothetical protein
METIFFNENEKETFNIRKRKILNYYLQVLKNPKKEESENTSISDRKENLEYFYNIVNTNYKNYKTMYAEKLDAHQQKNIYIQFYMNLYTIFLLIHTYLNKHTKSLTDNTATDIIRIFLIIDQNSYNYNRLLDDNAKINFITSKLKDDINIKEYFTTINGTDNDKVNLLNNYLEVKN